MIGQVENITRFGLFVKFVADDAIPSQTGLLRWSALPKGYPKLHIGDFIGISISKIHEEGKIDLAFVEKDFKRTYGSFLENSEKRLETLEKINRDLLTQ